MVQGGTVVAHKEDQFEIHNLLQCTEIQSRRHTLDTIPVLVSRRI